jgi:hypothetical protein
MKSFKFYEDYLKQNEVQAQKYSAYKEKVNKAQATVDVAKIKADEVIHSEISSGFDKSAEKTADRKAIAKAEQDLAHAIEEQAAAQAFLKDKSASIRDADVVQAWLNDYSPAVKAEHLPGIQERVKVGQELLLSALYDYDQLKREYGGITEEIQQLNNTAKESGRQRDYYAITNPINNLNATGFSASNLAKMLDDTLKGAALPAEITYRKGVE